MGRNQIYRGDPEVKKNYEIDNFTGGMNTRDADDAIKDSDFRLLQNGEIDNKGIAKSRRGSRRLRGLEAILERSLGKGIPKDVYYFKLINDDGNLLETALFDEDNVEYLMSENPPYNIKFVCIHREVGITTDFVFYLDYFNIDIKADKIEVFRESNLYPNIAITDTEYNIQATEFNNSIIFSIDKGVMFRFDLQDFDDTTREDEGDYTGDLLTIQSPKMTWYETGKTSVTYPVYKPTPMEIRKIGFNVVTGSPLTYVDNQGITEKTIQGIYFVDSDGIPIMSLPLGNKVRLYIMYTGIISAFDVVMKDGDTVLKSTATINNELSTTGLKVYDIMVSDISPMEVEIDISVTGDTSVGTYRDFYPIEQIVKVKKAIVPLDISQFDGISIKGRMCYYKGLMMWFSELDKFDYVPNYNYIQLELPYSDEIVKIAYFRNNYIIFSRLNIYKMSGTFGDSDFKIELINGAMGCIDPKSVKYLDNFLIFMSDRGLTLLRSDKYTPGFENVQKIDWNIDNYIDKDLAKPKNSFLYLNKYVYFVGYNTYKYYTDLGSFAVDLSNFFPENMSQYKGLLYFTSNDTVKDTTHLYLYDTEGYYQDDVVDEYEEYNMRIITSGSNIGKPMHDKKIKHVYLKVEHGKDIVPVRVALIGDGHTLYNPSQFKASVNSVGEVQYDEIITDTFTLDTNAPELGGIVLGTSKLGGTNMTVHKLVYPCKIKNVALDISVQAGASFALYVIGYVYKLKKVRGE